VAMPIHALTARGWPCPCQTLSRHTLFLSPLPPFCHPPLTHSTCTLRSRLRPHHSGPLGCRNVSTRVPPARLHVSDKRSRECCRTGGQEGSAIGLG
jgi:hypothetical protein